LSEQLAYLVIREGTKWTDVLRLVPGRTVTIGRAPTNQVVIKDESCSRYHAELFVTQGTWTLRDLDSRNGTAVGGQRIEGDRPLTPGDVIRISHSQMAFVHDLSTAFPDSSSEQEPPEKQVAVEETVAGRLDEDSSVLAVHEPTHIMHRRGQTKFLGAAEEESDDVHAPKVGKAAAKLCRLAFELAKQTDIPAVAELAIEGVFDGILADAGAVLLVPQEFRGLPSGKDMEVIASRSQAVSSYHPVSNFLATTVLREGEAVLARNVGDDSALAGRGDDGEIHATSVMCAPIRQGDRISGMIHLYTTDPQRVPDADDLEFALAVADNVGLALTNLQQRRELSENLSRSRNEVVQLRQQLGAESEIVGSSPLMDGVQAEIARAAPSRATVIIRGESGAGKELVARAVHYASPRKKGPFVCLNCAALSETLLESELFGHEKGAFTGATDKKVGKFEAADGGTLMLDEIGEMGLGIQAKFLRVLEGHPFERVGGHNPIKVDVRVIAATNRDIEKAVSEGKFRRDLYFRLHVVELRVPPLRKRPEDIADLTNFFVTRFNAETGRKIRGLTTEAWRKLRDYRWPGNVRELKNVIERAVLLTRSDYIDSDDLFLSNLSTATDSAEYAANGYSFEEISLAEMERRHISATLHSTGWNKSRAAGILGIERSTLDRKIRRYEIAQDESAVR